MQEKSKSAYEPRKWAETQILSKSKPKIISQRFFFNRSKQSGPDQADQSTQNGTNATNAAANADGSSEPCLNNYPKYSVTSQRSSFNFGANHLRNDVTLMLVGLIVVFFICQAPSTILRLITFKNLTLFFNKTYQSTLDISNFLVVCNSTVNCILYVMLGKKFRAEFFKTFCPKLYRRNQASNYYSN